jgi:hypothetical protein
MKYNVIITKQRYAPESITPKDYGIKPIPQANAYLFRFLLV